MRGPRRMRAGTRPAIPLLGPRVAAHVIAVLLPESRGVPVHQLDAAHPLRRLPEVQVRHDQASRAAVLGEEWLAVVVGRDEVPLPQEIIERQVGRIVGISVHQGMRRRCPHARARQQRRDRDAREDVVVARPLGHAMDVAEHFAHRQPAEFLPADLEGPLDLAEYAERPVTEVCAGHVAVVQHRPLRRRVLAGREALTILRPDVEGIGHGLKKMSCGAATLQPCNA